MTSAGGVAAIVTTGTELVTGEVVDTNSAWIARTLGAIGIDIVSHQSVGDDAAEVAAAITAAAAPGRLVVVSGGLGPTPDDLTREALALACGQPLEEHPEARASIDDYLRAAGRAIRRAGDKQLLAPRGARVIANPVGTAPGIEIELAGAAVLALPGVPREMRALLEGLLPELERRFAAGVSRGEACFGFAGLPESRLGELLAGLEEGTPGLSWGTAAGGGTIHVILRARGAPAQVGEALRVGEALLLERAGKYLYGRGRGSLAAALVSLLAQRAESLAVAESCTGGRIASELTAVPGASKVFLLGAVTYANSAKERVLGVPSSMLAEHGAVSPEVATAMAVGVAEAAGADWGLSTTGVAGPGGGTDLRPVGLVHVGLCRRRPSGAPLAHSIELRLAGDREAIQVRGAQGALWRLLQEIRGEGS